MKVTSNNTCEGQSGRTFSFIFCFLGLVAALTILNGTPCFADTVYSGISVGSNGTVYGWGVTDARSMSSHTTHMTSTLSSPNGRHASGSASGGAYTRVDLSLAFDPSDTGRFQEDDRHWAFCPVLGFWFWNGVHTIASTTYAYPINFRQVGTGLDVGNGILEFNYSWQSSSGTLGDLSVCVIYETVTYGDGHSPFIWPNPPWNHSNQNPVVTGVPATDGMFTDDHLNGGDSWTKPYQERTFTATQYYKYTCSGGPEVTLMGPLSIVRSVTQNPNGTFKYQVTKSEASATLSPLP